MIRIASVQMTLPYSRPAQPAVHDPQPHPTGTTRPAKDQFVTTDPPRARHITDAAFATIAGTQSVLPPRFVPAFQPLFADPLPHLPTLAPADDADGGAPRSSPAATSLAG